MNERIQELIDQATIRGVEYLAGNDGYPTPTIYFDKEKFAELIISECSAVANHFSDGHIIDGFGRKMFHYRADIAQEINQYFGVEE